MTSVSLTPTTESTTNEHLPPLNPGQHQIACTLEPGLDGATLRTYRYLDQKLPTALAQGTRGKCGSTRWPSGGRPGVTRRSHPTEHDVYFDFLLPMQNVLKFHLSESSVRPSVSDRRVCSLTKYEHDGHVVMLWKSVPAAPRGPVPLGNVGTGTTDAEVTMSINQPASSSWSVVYWM